MGMLRLLNNEEQQEIEREHLLATIEGFNNLTDSLVDILHFYQLEQRSNEHIASIVKCFTQKFLSTEEQWQKLPNHVVRNFIPCLLRSENDIFSEIAGPHMLNSMQRLQIFEQPY